MNRTTRREKYISGQGKPRRTKSGRLLRNYFLNWWLSFFVQQTARWTLAISHMLPHTRTNGFFRVITSQAIMPLQNTHYSCHRSNESFRVHFLFQQVTQFMIVSIRLNLFARPNRSSANRTKCFQLTKIIIFVYISHEFVGQQSW